jgi:hypothetical protein
MGFRSGGGLQVEFIELMSRSLLLQINPGSLQGKNGQRIAYLSLFNHLQRFRACHFFPIF